MFSADDGMSGIELWTSNGTAAGTALVMDINPGAASSGPGSSYPDTWSRPGFFRAVNGTIYFRTRGHVVAIGM